MVDDTSASIITLHQPKRPKTPAERARAYRERKKGKSLQVPTEHAVGAPSMLAPLTPLPSQAVTLRHVTAVTPSRFKPNNLLLLVAALASPGWAPSKMAGSRSPRARDPGRRHVVPDPWRGQRCDCLGPALGRCLGVGGAPAGAALAGCWSGSRPSSSPSWARSASRAPT